MGPMYYSNDSQGTLSIIYVAFFIMAGERERSSLASIPSQVLAEREKICSTPSFSNSAPYARIDVNKTHTVHEHESHSTKSPVNHLQQAAKRKGRATVASKIRYLQEYHNRVQHNIYPVPSGTDIANTLKYFSQTLLSVLRDAPSDRGGQGQQSRDAQLSEYPSLDYQGLYVTLVTLLDLVPLLQHGQHVGSTRREAGVPAYVNLSASSMLMIAMQYTSNPVYHCQLLECLMKHKQEVWKDLLYVISYGPSQVKPPAVQMLFHYWPNLKPPGAISEYRGLQYTAEISAICQKKNCSSHVRRAVVTCFSAGCCGRHGNRPVRYCKRCHVNHHSSEVGAAAETHLYQTSPPPINTRECGAEELVCTVEAVISLLKEAEIHAEQREFELNRRRQMGLSASHHSLDNIEFDNKEDDQHDQRLLSQFGIWFLVSLCTPNENTPTESLARLVSMVFQWFHSTAYMMDDEVGSLVEKLKPQFVTKWLKTVCEVRFDVMVGGYWDKSCSTVTQLKEGLNRILCLIPYNVISQPLWECFMPEWLEAIRTEVPDHQLKEFREVLRYIHLPTVLSELDIVVPLQLLIGMFSDGVNSLKELANQRKARVSDLTGNTGTRRVSVVSDPGRRGQHNTLSPFPSPFRSPFRSPLRCSPFKNLGHATGHCALDLDCDDDDMNLGCFILMFDLILKQMELQDDGVMLGLDSSLGKDIVGIINNVFQAPWGGSHTCQKDEKALECSLCQSSILCYQLGCELLERLTPREEIRLVEPTDNLEETLLMPQPGFCFGVENESEEGDNPSGTNTDNPSNHSPDNAPMKNNSDKKFSYQQLPVSLKLIYTILQEMSKFEEPDILFNMLNCLKILCLQGECLYIARKDHPQFLAYIQEKMLIPCLWSMLKSEFCQLAHLAVPQLLHALSLSHGADIFWNLINTNFNNKDWKIRFEAVEKVAVLCRFLDIGAVTKNHLLKYSLAHAFCCFLASVEDVNPAVATRARLLLDTIKRPALQKHHNLIVLFRTAITAVRTNVANLSDAAMWKIRRARFARNRQKSVRSLRDSVKGQTVSKRAFSLPESLSNRLPRFLPHFNPDASAPLVGQTPSPEDDSIIRDLLPEDAGIDHQTVHQLIMVLMKFMSKDQSSAEADIGSAKAFNTVKRHLYVLLGYDQQEGCFMIAPQKMRTSTCFNAFIAGIAQVMDYNISLGKQLLPLVVQVLKYCTCPQLRHYFQQPPRCSLWALKPHIRQMWLKALLVILYKYPYRDMDGSKVVLHLIHITINTLNAQYHSCRPHATAGPLYSDNSNVSRYSEKEKEEDSVFDESDVHDTPTGAANKESQTFFARLKRIGGSKSVKYQPVELNAKKSEIELSEYRESSVLQDSILHCVREESTRKKRLQAMHKQKSLDISNTDSILFNLDEHRRKSCIDRCDLQAAPVILPPSSATSHSRHHGKGSSDGSSVRVEGGDPVDRRGSRGGQSDISKPVIPEVRLSCMETFEDKMDQSSLAGSIQEKDDQDLIDLSSDCTSIPEKHSLLSMSDSDSLVFEPLPPLRIVESDEEYDPNTIISSRLNGSPKVASPASSNTLRLSPVVQVSVEDCASDKTIPDLLVGEEKKPNIVTPSTSLDLPDRQENVCHESPMTLKQKRDLLRKTPRVPDTSLDDMSMTPEERKQRKIAVSAIQREYLDISFNTFDKLGGDQTAETAQYRQVKRGSLGTLTMSQLMKRQLEHQSSAPHNISTWETGPTKTSLLSAPSTVSMFVPAPEEFIDEQPTTMSDRCRDCAAVLEEYDEETLSLAVVVLSMFIHLSPDLAAPMLLDIMQSVGRLASSANFSGQAESMLIPGNVAGVAKQFLRCMFHQLAPNGILPQLFQSNIKDGSFLRTLASSLIDFNELSSVAALNMLLEGLNNKKNLPAGGTMLHCLDNIATFMEALPMDSPSNLWPTICNQFQTFLTKLPSVLPLKSLLEPFSKLLSFVIQYGLFSLSYLVELCGLCYKAFNKMDLQSSTTVNAPCFMSPAVLIFYTPFNFLPYNIRFSKPRGTMSNWFWSPFCAAVLWQATEFMLPSQREQGRVIIEKGSLAASVHLLHSLSLHTQERDKFYMSRIVVLELLQALKFKSSLPDTNLLLLVQCTTAAMECMRQYISELLDFIADMHTLTKLKSHMKACCQPLHEDTFGGNLKVGLAQVAAMEISKGNHRDNKAVVRYLPWLYHPPSTMQQGPKEFIECVSHIRQLSWLLLGSLTHCSLHQGSTSCMPIPLDAGSHIADHLIVILIGFPEQSKLWTIYCEQAAAAPSLQNQNQTEFSSIAILTGLEFWSRVTPSILQLMAHNKVLIPMWLPMIQSNLKHLSAGLQLRLQAIQNRVNHQNLQGQTSGAPPFALRKWLQCTQFKMAQSSDQSEANLTSSSSSGFVTR
ncbi:Protein unc-79 -like protein [Channa argus]|uniref:Protein unc-79-like protein n=1 Tax=Channa argus TaxID=215402 RepID=A0A6G1QFK9_CHAAH|nr:Protein unc-79 -like protein [Channa argus]